MEKDPISTTQAITILQNDFNLTDIHAVEGKQWKFPLPALSNNITRANIMHEFTARTSEGMPVRMITRAISNIRPNVNTQTTIIPEETRIGDFGAIISVPEDTQHISFFVTPANATDEAIAGIYIKRLADQFMAMNPTIESRIKQLYGEQFTPKDFLAYSVDHQKLIFLG
jgi:hypothetical protein